MMPRRSPRTFFRTHIGSRIVAARIISGRKRASGRIPVGVSRGVSCVSRRWSWGSCCTRVVSVMASRWRSCGRRCCAERVVPWWRVVWGVIAHVLQLLRCLSDTLKTKKGKRFNAPYSEALRIVTSPSPWYVVGTRGRGNRCR